MFDLHKREITAEQYNRAIALNKGYLTKHDTNKVFTEAEMIGYGCLPSNVFEQDGKYWVWYYISDTCD